MGVNRQPQITRESCLLEEREVSLQECVVCKSSFPLKMERFPAVSLLGHHYTIIIDIITEKFVGARHNA